MAMKSEVKEKFPTTIEICVSPSVAAEDSCLLVCDVLLLGRWITRPVVPIYLRVKDRSFRRKGQGQRVQCKVQGQNVVIQARVKDRAFVAGTKDRDFICDGQGQRVHMQGSRTVR